MHDHTALPPATIDSFSAPVNRRQWLTLAGAGVTAATLPGWARAQTSAAAATAAPATAPRYPALGAYLTQYVSSRRLPGAIAAIGRDGRPPDYVFAGTIAFDSQTRVNSDTLWRFYSMTKPITGIAAMMLIDEGRMQLDQPLADILPAYREMQVLRSANGPLDQVDPARQPITLRHLLTHTAGLGYNIVQSGPIKAAYEQAGIVPGLVSKMRVPGLTDGVPAPSLAAFADRLARLPLVYQPGSRWSYSVGLDLMGRVIEVVSGQPFGSFIKSRILDPLDMRNTGFQANAAQSARLATNYAPFMGVMLPIDPGPASIFRDPPPFAFGGAGLVGSARDYDRFLWMLANLGELNGTRILSENAARMAMSNLLPEGAATTDPLVRGAGFGAGGRVGSEHSSTTFGWGGAAGTIAFVDPVRKIRFGGYANYMPPTIYDFQQQIPNILLRDLMRRG